MGRNSKELDKMEDLEAEGVRARSSSGKDWIVSGKVTPLWRNAGVHQADHLTSAGQIIPDQLVKDYILGRGCNYN